MIFIFINPYIKRKKIHQNQFYLLHTFKIHQKFLLHPHTNAIPIISSLQTTNQPPSQAGKLSEGLYVSCPWRADLPRDILQNIHDGGRKNKKKVFLREWWRILLHYCTYTLSTLSHAFSLFPQGLYIAITIPSSSYIHTHTHVSSITVIQNRELVPLGVYSFVYLCIRIYTYIIHSHLYIYICIEREHLQ